MRNEAVTFNDVLITPKFSTVKSRKDVDLSTDLGNGLKLSLPIISSNMSTITEASMAVAVAWAGGLGILHRFCTVEDNVKMLKVVLNGIKNSGNAGHVGVSIGIEKKERKRAEALIDAGATIVCIDVAHGAQQSVVDQVTWIRNKYKDKIFLIVGNFATGASITAFKEACKKNKKPDLYKVGIGPGSVCTTRLKTGVGVPQLSAIGDCARVASVIADGGIKCPGDIAKSFAQGAKAVMLGGMLSGTYETPGEVIANGGVRTVNSNGTEMISLSDPNLPNLYKEYRGSATKGYGKGWKTSEGVEIKVPYKGYVGPILKDIEGGLRSAFTYVGAATFDEFAQKAELLVVSRATGDENGVSDG